MNINEILIPTLIITTFSLIIQYLLNRYKLSVAYPIISKIENGVIVFFLNSFIFLYFFYRVSDVVWRNDIVIYLIYSFILFSVLTIMDIFNKWNKLNNFLLTLLLNIILIVLWFYLFFY